MTQTVTERVKAASSPSAALVVLAEAVDELYAQKPAGDPWSEWEASTETEQEWKPQPWVKPAIEELESKLAGETDEQEAKALRAKIELLKDELVPPPEMHDGTGDRSVETASPDGTVTIDLPPATDEQKAAREALLPRLGLIDEYGKEMGAQYEVAYIKGGPLLLYYADRDYVARLPLDIQQQFVDDVEQYSQQEAHEMARDLFRDPSPGKLPSLQ